MNDTYKLDWVIDESKNIYLYSAPRMNPRAERMEFFLYIENKVYRLCNDWVSNNGIDVVYFSDNICEKISFNNLEKEVRLIFDVYRKEWPAISPDKKFILKRKSVQS